MTRRKFFPGVNVIVDAGKPMAITDPELMGCSFAAIRSIERFEIICPSRMLPGILAYLTSGGFDDKQVDLTDDIRFFRIVAERAVPPPVVAQSRVVAPIPEIEDIDHER